MIQLRSGALRCDILPELGGCIAGFWREGEPVLRSTPPERLSSARLSGGYALVPFSNRIGQASLVWQGTQHPLVRNDGDEPHAIHGVGWQRPWSVLDCGSDAAMLSYEHRADAAWPFAFDCSHTLRLAPDALEMTLALTNQSDRAAPAGLGWHPFFVKRARSHIRFAASSRWDMGPDKLPTVRRPSPGLDTDCAALAVDHCFEGWDGVALLHDEKLQLRVRSDLRRLVVFTEPQREHIAIEPVSHVNNAVQLVAQGTAAEDLGLRVLQPGESMMAQMRIEVEAVA
jgi:aldose 1-epimerase